MRHPHPSARRDVPLAGCVPWCRAVLLALSVLAPTAGPAVAASDPPRVADRGATRLERQMRQRGVDPDVHGNPLGFTEAMRRAARENAGGGRPLERLRRLQAFLFDDARFPFDYGSRENYTAIEAFERRRGNCVSFTNLFLALSRSIGLPVRAALRGGGTSELQGDLVIVNEHIVAVYEHSGGAVVFDFNLSSDRRRVGLTVVDDLRVVAIYLNNRAVEALLAGRPAAARRDLDAALRLAPDYAGALGNLGVVRGRLGDTAGALEAFAVALRFDPRSPTVLSNVAALHLAAGRDAEARAAIQAARLRGATPYTLIVRGDLESSEGRVRRALRLYRDAARARDDIPEPWVAIARVELGRGRRDAARRALRRALRIAPGDEAALAIAARLDASEN